jgi:hypothetical protein
VIADRSIFEPSDKVDCGTTNVDFTAWLWAALAEMRSSRETLFRIGAEGLAVQTSGHGGRFEEKVTVPNDWVRSFLQLQGAMTLPGTRLSVRPVDLLAAIRFLRYTKAKVSPRAIRYVFAPDKEPKLVLEPWEHEIVLSGAEHAFTEERVIRTWGRRRLSLLEPLLPYADRVDVYLKGRALPSFYAIKLPGITFILGLSGWTSQRWSSSSSFDLLVAPEKDPGLKELALGELRRNYHLTVQELANRLTVDLPAASQVLAGLCAEGRCIFDVESREFRHRELFNTPIDFAEVYPPDKRRENAKSHIAANQVTIVGSQIRETRKKRKLKTPDGPCYRELVFQDWVVQGRVAGQGDVEVVLNDEDRVIFGRCSCEFFKDNLLNQGPCEHLLALFLVAQPLRKDSRVAVEVDKSDFESERSTRPRTEGAEDSSEDDLDDTKEVDENA